MTSAFIDPKSGCVRTDIQIEWEATAHYADGSPTTKVFYTNPGWTEVDALNRARQIWTTAKADRNAFVRKVREPLAPWPEEA